VTPADFDETASDRRFEGADIPVSAHQGDDGSVDPVIAELLVGLAKGTVDHRSLQHALVGARVLLPTAAFLDESAVSESTGLEHEKSSHLSAAVFRAKAGWNGLLVFTSVASLNAWDTQARPVPITADEAAIAALEEGCEVLVLDFEGPARAVLAGSLLRALAQSRKALPPAHDPVVIETITAAGDAIDGLVRVDVHEIETVPELLVEHGDDASGESVPDAVVLLTPSEGADAQALAAELAAVLSREPVLRDRLDGGLAFVLSLSDG